MGHSRPVRQHEPRPEPPVTYTEKITLPKDKEKRRTVIKSRKL